MKNKTHKTCIRHLAIAGLCAGAASLASAAAPGGDAGLLGERYVGATIDYVVFDGDALDDGIGVTLAYNNPLNEEIDLSVTYSYLGSEAYDSTNVTSHALLVGATFHSQMGQGRGLLRVELGVNRLKAGGSETEIPYALTLGYELPLNAEFALTPFVTWSDLVDSDLDVDGTFDLGVLASWRVSETLDIVGTVTRNDDSDLGLSAGVAYRF